MNDEYSKFTFKYGNKFSIFKVYFLAYLDLRPKR